MPKRRRLSPDDYTVGWVCALPIELAAAQEMLDETHEGIDNHDAAVVYTLGRISEHNAVLACLPKGQIGTNSAAMVAVQLQSAFPSIRVGVLVGIGGGVPSAADVRLGDVVVSQPGKLHGGVVQYDFGKSTPSGIERTGYLNAPPAILLEAVAKVQAKHHRGQTTLYDNIAHFDSLSAFSETNALEDVLFAADNGHVGGPTCKNCSKDKGLVQRGARDEGVVIHYGTIASGNLVIRDGLERDRVSSELGNVHCFEMEAAGLMNTFPCLVIRGICDYADSHKNKDWQPHASAMAAAYAKKLLSVVPPAAVARARTVVEILTESKVIQDTLSRLPYAVEAIFNSYQRQHERTCLVETRTQVLQEINSWANRADESSIFWLSGWAGIGKSTIARTIARKYHDEQRLGASFFFSKGGGDIGHAGKFATTIARQLANNIPPLQPLVCQAVAACGDIGTQSLSDQWRQLVFEPLSKLDNNTWSEPSYILVIDALDECDDDRSIRAILHLLTKAQPVFYKVVKVLITSRPNLPVRHGISQIPRPNHCKLILHELSPEDLDYDINVYLEHELSIIAQEVGLNLPWPGAEAIRQLVESASGLFIWSATACRFIHEGGMFAEERLNTILQPKESRTAPEESLNEIYSSVLNSSVGPTLEPQEREIFCTLLRQILGTIVVLSSPLSLGSIGNLLQVRKRWLDNVMDQLHAILDIPDDTSRPLRLHHPSFRDFLLDEDRCKDPKFWVDEKKAHGLLADRCLQLMSSTLKEDICGVGAPGTPRDELNETQIQQFLPLEVQYACLFWVQHLGKSNTTLKDDDAVHKFLNDNVLYWFEALSWIQRLPQGIFALITLESIALQGKCSQLQALIWGIKRFAQASKSVMEEAPLQVYLGSLVFAPSSSIVRNRFQDRALKWVRKVPTFRTNWSPLQQTLESHSRGACSVLFSPDGTILAYASWDTVQLWDPLTGQCLQTLKENSDLPNDYDRPLRRDIYKTIAFSNIGKILASTSDRTLDLWDWSTGLSLQTFKGHNGLITQIAFSCDAETIASGSTDQTVRLWSPYTGKSLGILTGHTGCIHAVAFSPASQSANILASASDDSTIRVWNSFTGQCLSILHTNNPINHALVFSSDGGMLASARGGRGETVYFSSPGTWDFNQSVHLWDPFCSTVVLRIPQDKGTRVEEKYGVPWWSEAFSRAYAT